jgi:hypothetical protein
VDGIDGQLVSEWDESVYDTQLRLAALKIALQGYNHDALSGQTVYDIAEKIYRWANKRTPATIKIVAIGDVTRQNQQEDQPMQIRDNEQFTVTLEVDDAKGFAIQGDQLTVTSADESVATVQDQGNGTYLVVAGNPGSTVITFDAGTDDNGNQVTATEAVDVVAGNVATVKVTEGAVTAQGATAPAATEPGPDPTAGQTV